MRKKRTPKQNRDQTWVRSEVFRQLKAGQNNKYDIAKTSSLTQVWSSKMSIFNRQHSLNLKCRGNFSFFVFFHTVLSIFGQCKKWFNEFFSQYNCFDEKNKTFVIIRNLEFVKACCNKLIYSFLGCHFRWSSTCWPLCGS